MKMYMLYGKNETKIIQMNANDSIMFKSSIDTWKYTLTIQ